MRLAKCKALRMALRLYIFGICDDQWIGDFPGVLKKFYLLTKLPYNY